jgi:hypothetical protein
MRRNTLPGSAGRTWLRELALWVLYAPAVLVFAWHAWQTVRHSAGVVAFPYQIDYGEAPELNRALLLARGEQIYVDVTAPPYQMANYTPLYPAIVSLFARFTGPEFLPGRAVSFASTLVAAGALACVARALGAPWVAATLAGLIWLSHHAVFRWGAYQRVDSFAVALELVGLALFCNGWVRHRHVAALWWCLPVFLAAAFARQTIAAGAFACFTYLLFVRPRLALAAGGACIAAGLALVGLLLVTTRGWFWWHVVEGNLNLWSWEIFHRYWDPWWELWRWAFGLGVPTLLALLAARRSQVPLLYLAAAAATVLTMGKIGAYVNYLLQLCAAISLVCGLAPLAVNVLAARIRPAGALHAVVAVVLLWGGLQLREARRRPDTLYWAQATAEERDSARQAHARVAHLQGDLLSEDMSFTVTTGKRLYFQPFEFSQQVEQGEWDQGPLLADVRRGHFVAVVLRFDLAGDPSWHGERFTRPLLDALRESYVPDAVYGDYFIYRPRPG